MFATAYRRNHSLSRNSRETNRNPPAITAMTDNRSQIPSQQNHVLVPIPPVRESLSVNSTSVKSSSTSRPRSHTNESVTSKSAQRTYTFHNPPCELQRRRISSLRERVSSAPDENSPRSRCNQLKSSSAKGALTPRSPDDSISSKNSTSDSSQIDQKVKDSLNALIKEQQKSKVPKSVQKRRILLLFPRSSPENNTPTPLPQETPIINPQPPSDNFEGEIADTMELAAILAQIQHYDDSIPTNSSSTSQSQLKSDPSKYEYVVTSPLDMATYRLSPRTLKPNEELAARSRFSQYYRAEMRSSANAQIPSLIASIVTDNQNTLGNELDREQIFTIKLNPTDPMNQSSVSDEHRSTSDNELVELCYDATLKRFYDPHTGKYYELTSE